MYYLPAASKNIRVIKKVGNKIINCPSRVTKYDSCDSEDDENPQKIDLEVHKQLKQEKNSQYYINEKSENSSPMAIPIHTEALLCTFLDGGSTQKQSCIPKKMESNLGTTWDPLAKNLPLQQRHPNDEKFDQKKYQEAISSINYAAIATQPDISFVSGLLGQFVTDPSMIHRAAVK
jgi:hypothetical protein